MSTTWNSASTGTSSSSSERFNLNEHDKSHILLYKYRSGRPCLEISSEQDLCKFLDKACNSFSTLQATASSDTKSSISKSTDGSSVAPDPKLRVARKKIPRGNSRVDIRMEDLYTDVEREAYADYPSSKNSLANVGLPSSVYWKRLFFNSYPDLYIVSPLSSPENSVNNSPESSQHVSPHNTFPKERPQQQDSQAESSQ